MALQAKTKERIERVAVPFLLLLIAAAGGILVYHPLLNLEFEFTRSIGHALIIGWNPGPDCGCLRKDASLARSVSRH